MRLAVVVCALGVRVETEGIDGSPEIQASLADVAPARLALAALLGAAGPLANASALEAMGVAPRAPGTVPIEGPGLARWAEAAPGLFAPGPREPDWEDVLHLAEESRAVGSEGVPQTLLDLRGGGLARRLGLESQFNALLKKGGTEVADVLTSEQYHKLRTNPRLVPLLAAIEESVVDHMVTVDHVPKPAAELAIFLLNHINNDFPGKRRALELIFAKATEALKSQSAHRKLVEMAGAAGEVLVVAHLRQLVRGLRGVLRTAGVDVVAAKSAALPAPDAAREVERASAAPERGLGHFIAARGLPAWLLTRIARPRDERQISILPYQAGPIHLA